MFILQVLSESGADPSAEDHDIPTDAPQVLTVKQGAGASQVSTNTVQVSTPVPTNVFTWTLKGTLGFTTVLIKVLAEDGYDTQEEVLYWIFIGIKE